MHAPAQEKTDAQAQIDMVDRLLEWGQVTAPTRILDVGCGVGGSSRHMAHKYPGKLRPSLLVASLQPARSRHALFLRRRQGYWRNAQPRAVRPRHGT